VRLDENQDHQKDQKGAAFVDAVGRARVCLGTLDFGTRIPRDEAFALLDRYVELGGCLIDTANNYADWYGLGNRRAETVLGEWLATRRPERLILGTKAGFNWNGDPGVGLTRVYLEQEIDRSLESLRVEAIDVFWLHRDDPERSVGEICDTLTSLLDTGKIRRIGCSNWTLHRIEVFQAFASEQGFEKLTCIQPMWSLARRNPVEDGLGLIAFDESQLDFCAREGIVVFPYSSQACGFFSGQYREGAPLPRSSSAAWVERNYFCAENFARLKRVLHLASTKSCSPQSLALAYLLRAPVPTIPIIGPRSVTQLEESLAALTITLEEEELGFLTGGQRL
jgi:aryl-alcohol dehydrogenase-like predicted oxidoreductase